MTEPTERDIERLLSADEAPAPPAGLAGRIQREIPDGLRLDRSVLEGMARYRLGRHVPAYRQFVLLAALLLVTIGLGTLGLRALRCHTSTLTLQIGHSRPPGKQSTRIR